MAEETGPVVHSTNNVAARTTRCDADAAVLLELTDIPTHDVEDIVFYKRRVVTFRARSAEPLLDARLEFADQCRRRGQRHYRRGTYPAFAQHEAHVHVFNKLVAYCNVRID